MWSIDFQSCTCSFLLRNNGMLEQHRWDQSTNRSTDRQITSWTLLVLNINFEWLAKQSNRRWSKMVILIAWIPTCNDIELSSKLIMNVCEFLMMESTFSQNLSWDVIKSVKCSTNGGNATHWTVEVFEILGTSFGLNKILHESNLFCHSHSEK